MQPENITVQTQVPSIVFLARNYASYNSWANKTLVNWLRTKPAELLVQEVPSSFPTIQATLQHIWQAQCYWLGILRKDEDPRASLQPVTPTLDEVLDGIVAQSQEMADFIETMVEEQVNEPVRVVNPWFECNFPAFEYVMQVMNHGTYHRGQVTTMGRHLGFTDAPMTDYNFYNVYGK